MHKNPAKNSLLKPSVAVESYFDNLLQDQGVDLEPSQSVPLDRSVNLLTGLERELARIDPQAVIGPQPEAVDGQQPPIDNEDLLQAGIDAPVADHDYARADFPLQCLMFSVQQHELSIPLIEMGSVQPWPAELTRIPRSPDWLLGLVKHRGTNVRVVDTARLLSIPAIRECGGGCHILVLSGQDWAITCDRIGKVIQLEAGDVQWNRASLKGLCSGPIKQSLALLLDPPKLLQHLNSLADANASPADTEN